MSQLMILGAGMTGLAAGFASGLPIYEAVEAPGGICSSYYLQSGETKRLHQTPEDQEAYRFELGGGHWIFGGDPLVLRFIRSLTPVKTYARKSSVYLPEQGIMVPYPIQNHLGHLGPGLASRALREMVEVAKVDYPVSTMADWLQASFGPTLCQLFFEPFHHLYTAGLLHHIAPQDSYKSPVNLSLVVQGAFEEAPPVGYNVNFIYPIEGLNVLAQRMAQLCNISFGKRAVQIDVRDNLVHFEDGASVKYETLLSTLPLNRMIEMTGLDVKGTPDPCTSVLVINIGAVRGPQCPDDHWLYVPTSQAGFHRVGFYSNVDSSFLPLSARATGDRVSIYVEMAFSQGHKPSDVETILLCNAVTAELQEWEWIGEVEVVDPTWIDTAYTWSYPGSTWRTEAMQALQRNDIFPVGRYARWVFQGIADSIRDGFIAGKALKTTDLPTVIER